MADNHCYRPQETFAAGLFGAVAGAAVATIVLTNEKTRKQLEKKIDEWKGMGMQKMDEMKKNMDEKKMKLDEKITQKEAEAENQINKTSKQAAKQVSGK